jgi:copper homeostasis protein
MLEICIDGVASARAAALGGADRVELCANLPEGGTTPSAGMIRAVRSAFTGGLMILIRPRGYDFLYSEDEMQVTLHDIQVARESGADGVVIGCLARNGRVDTRSCERLLSAAGSLDVTFHRASIMPGGGVTEENLAQIVKSTGVREIHLSARAAVISEMEFRNPDCSMGTYSRDHEYEWREASEEKISRARKILTDALTAR